MIKTVHVSHIGRVRSVNEDSAWIRNLDTGYILGIVADGMGGHLAGDTASRLAVETLVQDLATLEPGLSHASLSAALSDAILHANEVIFRTASTDDKYHNMGTTVVAALLNDAEGVIGHIGDSRAYKIAGKEVFQLTEDHTLVNELYKNGQISKEDVSHHPRRNVLTRALGTDAEVKVDMDAVRLEEGKYCFSAVTDSVTWSAMSRLFRLQATLTFHWKIVQIDCYSWHCLLEETIISLSLYLSLSSKTPHRWKRGVSHDWASARRTL